MRVLHLPFNLASQAAITVRALRQIGVEARGLIVETAAIQQADGVETLHLDVKGAPAAVRLSRLVQFWGKIYRAVAWADVIHWHSVGRGRPYWFALLLCRALGKPRFVEFWGSDIRAEDIACRDNPYLASVFAESGSVYRLTTEASYAIQRRFYEHGFTCLIPGPELQEYLIPEFANTFIRTEARLLPAEFVPAQPRPHSHRPVIVHAPSAQPIKGSRFVQDAVNGLRGQFDFEYCLTHNLPYAQALAAMAAADIVVDQLVIGSYGMVALEAMAFARPAVCYIHPRFQTRLKPGNPVANANPETLAGVLAGLLADPRRRLELGQAGRVYIEKHHDARQIAAQLKLLYEGRRG